jgi:hypothetical protein
MKYVAIMDADDVAYPNRIERQLDYLKFEGGDIFFTWGDLINSEGNVTGVKKTSNQNLLSATFLFSCPLIHTSAFWIKSVFCLA